MKPKQIVYSRSRRGDWFRNGRFCPNPPLRVLVIARDLALECTVTLKREAR